MTTYTHAYIYLIREREFLLRDEPVFKIGRGAQDADRIVKRVATGYKKGSEIWLAIRCALSVYKEVENGLKTTFRERFEKHGDGSEYFIGDPTAMVQLITTVVNDSWLSCGAADLSPCGNIDGKDKDPIEKIIDSMKQDIVEERKQFEQKEAKRLSNLMRLQHYLSNRTS